MYNDRINIRNNISMAIVFSFACPPALSIGHRVPFTQSFFFQIWYRKRFERQIMALESFPRNVGGVVDPGARRWPD